ncbi:MAG: peptidylprolyl isomerase [Planctomycetes bacterium]|nr:peptidylprolyl isomerase [Planctomycetota bacterium]
MQITKNATVSIHYTLKNDDDVILDTSEGRDPLAFEYGVGQIIPGLEAALEGKVAGDSISVRIDPKDGYGEKNEAMIQTIPREHMPDGVELQVGMQLQAQTPDGQAQLVTIVGLTNTDVTLDGNHPLAGVALNFAVEVVDVTGSSTEEATGSSDGSKDESGG